MEKILINIDSRQRDYSLFPSSSFFKLEYDTNQNNIKFINNNYLTFKNVDYIKVASVEIPNSFYVFHSSRDNITFKIDAVFLGPISPGSYSYPLNETTITIEEGNYNLSQFVNNLNKALGTAGYNTGHMNNCDYIVTAGLYFTVNTNTNLFTLHNPSSDYNFNINFENESLDYVSLGYMIGFRKGTYLLKETPNNTITSDYASDINGENYIFLRINDYGNIYLNPKVPIKILSKIILDKTKNNYVFNNGYDQINKTHKFRQPTDIKKLEIELLDYTGNRLNNNGLDYSLTLEIGFIYDEKLYLENLNSLELSKTPKFKSSEALLNYLDNNSIVENIQASNHPDLQIEANTIIEDVFNKPPEIVPVEEMINIEKKRSEKPKKKKKKKFGFEY